VYDYTIGMYQSHRLDRDLNVSRRLLCRVYDLCDRVALIERRRFAVSQDHGTLVSLSCSGRDERAGAGTSDQEE
jgi:hypothetical protein